MCCLERKQESGVHQGSTLSVTLFAVKVNSLAAGITNYIKLPFLLTIFRFRAVEIL